LKPYKILQVDRDAEHEVIEAAYKRLAGKYHPDKDPSASATQRMQEINAAYEVLRDPERRGRYDREQRRKRAERDRPQVVEVTPPQSEPKVSVETVSDRVFLKVVGVAALLAVLAYFPWAFVIFAGIWGLVWLVRRYPKGVAKIVAAAGSFAFAIGAYVWAQDWTQEAKAKDELKKLNVNDLLVDQLGKFTDDCDRTESSAQALQPRPPPGAPIDFAMAPAQRIVAQYARPAVTGPNPLATAYCSCLADALRSRFDSTAIIATSVDQYRDEYSSRFQAATPDKAAQSGCLNQVRPSPVAAPAVKVPAKPARPKQAPSPPAVDDLSAPPWEHLEVPTPPPQIVDLDKPIDRAGN
jgi:hypothetical protein